MCVQLIDDSPVDVQSIQAIGVSPQGLKLAGRAFDVQVVLEYPNAFAQRRRPDHARGLAVRDLGLVFPGGRRIDLGPRLVICVEEI